MNKLAVVMTLVVALLGAGSVHAQNKDELAIPGYPAMKDIPNVGELPDPKVTYKLVFPVNKGADGVDKVDPGLARVASMVNTFARYGVAADHRKFAIVLSGKSTPLIMTDAAFAAKNEGRHNPNLALIDSLKKAGVEIHVCGQAVLGHKIPLTDVAKTIEVDLSAPTTIINMQMRGYVRVGG